MRSGKARARILVYPIVVIAVMLVLGCSSSAGTQATPGPIAGAGSLRIESPTTPECPPAPCPGLAYELLYSQKDGSIIAMGAWDASLPGAPRPGDSYSPRPGEATLVIPTNDDARRIMDNPGAYFVDLSTRTVQPRPEPTAVSTPVAGQ